MKSLFTALVAVFLSASLLFAAEKAGEISEFKGSVKVYKEGDVRGKKVKEAGYEVFVKDIIKTKRRALAYLSLADKSRVILKGNSIMEIEGMKGLNVKEGKVLFNIKKQERLRGLRVRSKSVVIGVKGTEFLVDSDEEDIKIYLKEGQLNVESPEGEFKRYKKGEKEEFETYKEKNLKEFDEYKKEIEEEFIEYIKEFEMKSGTAVIISGSEVRDLTIPEEIEEEFNLFKADEEI